MKKLPLLCILAGITMIVYLISCPVCISANIISEDNLDTIPDIESPNEDESLNDIRFAGWTEDDFYCNDYLRAFRRYMNTWLQGKEIDEDIETDPSVLEPYRDRLSGKFLVINVKIFMFGGLLYELVPIDDPTLVISMWIYSIVDNDDGHIDGYLVRYIKVDDFEEAMREKGVSKDMVRQQLLEDSVGVMDILW